MVSERVKGHVCILAANVIFGVYIPVSKYLLKDFASPLFMTMCRMFGAAALFWLASLFVKDAKPSKRELAWFFVFALCGVLLNQGLFMYALGKTSPIDASVILTATPFAALFISYIYLKDPITRRKLLGIAVGAAGAIWLVMGAHGASGGGAGSAYGNMLVVFTTVCAASYFVLSKPLAAKFSAITIMKWMFLFASLMLMPLAPQGFAGDDSIKATFGFGECAALFYVVVFATFVAYLLLAQGIKRIRPTTVSMYIYVQPIVSSAVAIFVGQDSFSWAKLVAASLVFFGVYLVTSAPRTADQEKYLRKLEKNA